MRTAAGIGLATVVMLILQSAILPLTGIGPALPDLMLVVCVYLGLHVHSPAGAGGAFAIGYAEDSRSGCLLGLNAFAMCGVFATVYVASRRLWVDRVLSQLVLVFIASLEKIAIVVVLVAIFSSLEGLWRTMARYVFLEAMLAAALAPPVFAFLRRLLPEVAEE